VFSRITDENFRAIEIQFLREQVPAVKKIALGLQAPTGNFGQALAVPKNLRDLTKFILVICIKINKAARTDGDFPRIGSPLAYPISF